MNPTLTIVECERLAEAAYEAMYEARAHQVKHFYEEVRGHYWRAIQAAWAGRLFGEVVRLSQRFAEIDAVYNSQFRGIG